MDKQKLIQLNRLIAGAYECFSFQEFLKFSILQLHELISYDSGMFFCAISRDCSYFRPYAAGRVEQHYQKQPFPERQDYLKEKAMDGAGQEALVYKALDYSRGEIHVDPEPRSDFLSSQKDFHVACVRIVYKGQFLGEIYLHRSRETADFDEEEMFVLRLLQPHISMVFHVIHTVTAVNYLETEGGHLSKTGLCLLDKDLSLAGSNVTGLEMLKAQTIFGSSILYHVKELCEDMRTDAKGSAPILRSGIWKTDNGNLTADVLFYGSGSGRRNRRFFVSMEFEDGSQIVTDYKFKFTKREADLIDGVIQGKNNAQLAASLQLSENTIKTHICSIYRKVGARNRTELTYILMMSRQ
ncbi:MAG: LuxR C-terminal-related transcriptional regulator [Clostridiaceae bacterium]|nr:LuxR C-terminal-related transcriptional regulator [Clostridiaceae bacterium]